MVRSINIYSIIALITMDSRDAQIQAFQTAPVLSSKWDITLFIRRYWSFGLWHFKWLFRLGKLVFLWRMSLIVSPRAIIRPVKEEFYPSMADLWQKEILRTCIFIIKWWWQAGFSRRQRKDAVGVCLWFNIKTGHILALERIFRFWF